MHGCANAWAYLALHNCIVKHAQATTKTYIRDIQNKCIGILVWKLHSIPQMHGCVSAWAYLALHNCTVKHAQTTTQTYIRDTQNKCISWDPLWPRRNYTVYHRCMGVRTPEHIWHCTTAMPNTHKRPQKHTSAIYKISALGSLYGLGETP